jgi:RNA polymerase sigma-70 factor, ECF subfamily
LNYNIEIVMADYGKIMDNRPDDFEIGERHRIFDALMLGVKQGSRSAFRKLFELSSPKTYGILMRVLRNRSDADEVFQEVYLRIWTKSFLFDPARAHAECWISHMARHAAIDRLRAVGRRPQLEQYDDAFQSEDPGPEQTAVLQSEVRLMTTCLDRLDQNHRDAVRLAYVEGASYDELALRFDVPINTMKSWLRRSLRRLRACIEGEEQGDAQD